jgi:AraC family transcriptional regulator of adaptative response / DNA-3-methyladenine glycosylase II
MGCTARSSRALTKTIRMPFTGPLDWEAMLAYLQVRAIPGVERISDYTYRRTVALGDHAGTLELARGGDDHLLLRAALPSEDGVAHTVQRARRIFSLDAPVDRAREHLLGDAVIGPLVAARPGLRVPGTWDPFETAVRAIIGQQISLAGANTIIGRLVERLGRRDAAGVGLGVSRTFPPAHVLAENELGGLGLTRARTAAIRAFARSVESGAVRLDRSMTLDQLTDAIIAIPGLGPWTAHYVALRLGEPDAFPVDDLGLRRALRRIDPELVLKELAAHWSPWRATAAVHLWRVSA